MVEKQYCVQISRNRYIVECKVQASADKASKAIGRNRYIVECKAFSIGFPLYVRLVEIDTLWNVKFHQTALHILR